MNNNTFEIHTGHFAELNDKIAKANRKLDRNGIAGAFVARKVSERVEDNQDGTVDVYATIELERPALAAIAGWTFLASVSIEEGGTFLSVAPDQELPVGFVRPAAHHCDHCGQARNRTRSYILGHQDGRIVQVGSTCLEAFLGIEVKGLWMLEAFDAAELAELRETPEDRGPARAEQTYSVRGILALAHVITNGGKGFVSKRVAELSGKTSTTEEVMEHLFSNTRDQERRAAITANNEAAQALSQDVVAAIIESAATINAGDYRDNMFAAVQGEYITRRALGTLVSLVMVYARTLETAAEEKVAATKLNEAVGTVKERLRGLELTVVGLREIDGNYGTSTLFIMEDSLGRSFKWFASGTFTHEAGDVLTLDGTVKGHETYKGRLSTMLTRCKVLQAA